MAPNDPRRHELLRKLQELLGNDLAAALMESLPPDRWDHLATKDDLAAFATKADLERFATKADLEAFATKADLERFATKADLEPFATKADLEPFATKADLEPFATRTDVEHEFALMRLELRGIADVLGERITGEGHRLEALMRERIDVQTKQLLFSLLAAVMTTGTLAIAAVRF